MHTIELREREVVGFWFGFLLAAGQAFPIVIAIISTFSLVAAVPIFLGLDLHLFPARSLSDISICGSLPTALLLFTSRPISMGYGVA